MEEKSQNFAYIAIVAIVAVVALIVLVLGASGHSKVVTTTGTSEDTIGNAIKIRTCEIYYNGGGCDCKDLSRGYSVSWNEVGSLGHQECVNRCMRYYGCTTFTETSPVKLSDLN